MIPGYINDTTGLKLAIALTSSLKMKDSSIFIRVPLPEEIVKKINNFTANDYAPEQIYDETNDDVLIESPKSRKSELAQRLAEDQFSQKLVNSSYNSDF